MDNSLTLLCEAIKKICWQIKPQQNPCSFVILTGKANQGKSALLRQSQFTEFSLFSELYAKLYYNQQGILLELGEDWINHSPTLLKNALKALNRCHRNLRITGLILCVEINELLSPDPEQFVLQSKSLGQLAERFSQGLGYTAELALMISKADALAGFCEFFQSDHAAELAKPLGFSLTSLDRAHLNDSLNQQFNQLLESLNQSVINKIHPVRSTLKRTLIREFPLQLAAIRQPLLKLVQQLSQYRLHLFAVYIISAEQGGVSIDQINKRIEHEYALTVRDTYPQAANYRAYFIQGALLAIQLHTTQLPGIDNRPSKLMAGLGGAAAALVLGLVAIHYFKTVNLLDEASKELIAYDSLHQQGNRHYEALYHLSQASHTIDRINTNSLSSPTLSQLKNQLRLNTEQQLRHEFIPLLLANLESVITNAGDTPAERYKALKIYLMLADQSHFDQAVIENWFKEHWQKQDLSKNATELVLLKQTLTKPIAASALKEQLISDTRNYLNALPTSYLYYSLAKEAFPKDKTAVELTGFNLATQQIPVYFTKTGFKAVMKSIPQIAKQIEADNWVLARQDLNQFSDILRQTYCYDYVTWWQTFLRKSQPIDFQSYQEGKNVSEQLVKSKAFQTLLNRVQQETKPDFEQSDSVFNEAIASQFTELNLISQSSTNDLTQSLQELDQFFTTLAAVNDQGRTAFLVTKERFRNEQWSDPVSALYAKSSHLPEPVAKWSRQIADNAWMLLIKESRDYINRQWQQTAYREYQTLIAHRYPLDANQKEDIELADFNHFFAPHGSLNQFVEAYLKPFLNTSQAQWQPKTVNGFMLPLSPEMMNELIRANVITAMFFPDRSEETQIQFSLQKINLDPVIADLQLEIGQTRLNDTQNSESYTRFNWPQPNARLVLDSIDGNHYELAEKGVWALFKLLEKVNVLVDDQDSTTLQILFEINSNSGRYLLKSANQINPFTPGILNGFVLEESVV